LPDGVVAGRRIGQNLYPRIRYDGSGKNLPMAMQEAADRQYRQLNQICMTKLPLWSGLPGVAKLPGGRLP
jgi:hypothetical protein